MDADRLARYADRWVDFVNGLAIAAVTAVVAQSLLAGGVLLAVMLASSLASTLGRRVAGRSAVASASARARFGRSLVSALDSVRTVKLAASTPSVHAHLSEVDNGRVEAAVREHRVQALLDGVPIVMVQCGVVAAVGDPPHRRLGTGDRAARDERGHRVRLVRAGRRLGHHRGAGHPRRGC